MRKALAGVVMITFVGLLSTSFVAVFNGPMLQSHFLGSHSYSQSYFMAY